MKTPKMVLAAIALCISMAAFSQTDTTKIKKDSSTQKTDTTTRKKDTTNLTSDQSASAASQGISGQQTQSSTVTGSQSSTGTQAQTGTAAMEAKTATGSQPATTQESAPKPNFGRYYIPVLGSFQSSQSTATTTATAEGKTVIVTGDESNPGKIWVEGLTETKFYALLKTVPGTYKVPAQKADNGSIQEGTVMYDESSKQISICLGCGYKDAGSSEALATTSTDNNSAMDATAKELSKKSAKKSSLKEKAKTVINFTGTKSGEATASLNQ